MCIRDRREVARTARVIAFNRTFSWRPDRGRSGVRLAQASGPMLGRIQAQAIVVSADHDTSPISAALRHPRHSSWMLSRLTNETKDQHIGIDEGLLASFSSPSIGSYRHFLARMYGFSAPVGTALLATPACLLYTSDAA